MNIVHKVILEMENVPLRIKEIKVSQLISKNTGYQKLKQLSLILKGKSEGELLSNLTPTIAANMKYAQITTVDVLRSFS